MRNIICIKVHSASIHDTKIGFSVFVKAIKKYPIIQSICADASYRKTLKKLLLL